MMVSSNHVSSESKYWPGATALFVGLFNIALIFGSLNIVPTAYVSLSLREIIDALKYWPAEACAYFWQLGWT